MGYVRKTQDEWHVLVHYGQGWEHDCTENSRRDALARAKEYWANCSYPVKIQKVRVPVVVSDQVA